MNGKVPVLQMHIQGSLMLLTGENNFLALHFFTMAKNPRYNQLFKYMTKLTLTQNHLIGLFFIYYKYKR